MCWDISTVASFSYGLLCMAFCLSSLFCSIAVANTERHRLLIENDKLITSNIVYREVLLSFKFINNFSLIKYFVVSMRELFA